MPNTPESLIRELLSGPNIPFEQVIAPGAKLQTFMKPKGYIGPEGARQYWADAEAMGWDISLCVKGVQSAGDKALAHGQIKTSRDSLDSVQDVAWGCTAEDGLITQLCTFFSREEGEEWLRSD